MALKASRNWRVVFCQYKQKLLLAMHINIRNLAGFRTKPDIASHPESKDHLTPTALLSSKVPAPTWGDLRDHPAAQDSSSPSPWVAAAVGVAPLLLAFAVTA
jgi:hypothetical protein